MIEQFWANFGLAGCVIGALFYIWRTDLKALRIATGRLVRQMDRQNLILAKALKVDIREIDNVLTNGGDLFG